MKKSAWPQPWKKLVGEIQDSNVTQMLEAIKDLGGPADAIERCFERMDIAEQEIAAAKEEYPEVQDILHEAFCVCNSPVIPSSAPNELFRVHVRQLLRMIAQGWSIDRPTPMEKACMVVHTSQAVPISTDICLYVMSDAETMTAFEMEPVRHSLGDLPYLEDLFIETYRRLYKKMDGKQTRQERFNRVCKERVK